MPDIVDPAVEAYAVAHTTPEPWHLATTAAGVRGELSAPEMMVGLVEGRLLGLLVFALQAAAVLEIGTFGGYSALSMAEGLPEGGRITTCELDPTHAAVARRHVAASPYAGQIDVVEGPALETVRALPGPFDLVFIDADKGSYLDYYEAVLPKLARRGLIVADNTLWGGRVLDPGDHSADTEAIRAFNDRVAGDGRVVAVQATVRDGVTLIRHREP
ncbi:MAG: class I SAM-dependent methyltransferase [Actinomycetota bacterium]|nr:class I SAM-dependent methyltransferase [Actinomycetota bacterium]